MARPRRRAPASVPPAAAACDASPAASSRCSSPEASPAASPGGPRPFQLRVNLSACKYPVLRVVLRQLGWVECDDEEAPLHWTDTSAGTDRLVRLSRPQKLNHFPGMLEIARKKGLARNLAAMRAMFPEEYDFSPRTFLLPEMMEAFEAELAQGGGSAGAAGTAGGSAGGAASNAAGDAAAGAAAGGGAGGRRAARRPTFILKLDNGSMGRGIKLVQTLAQAAAALPTFEHENVVASQYVDRPFLIDGKKFDLRIYVLVRCCDPLRVFLCREGLVRFCTEPYEPPAPSNLDNAFAHLTNYAVNKANPHFVFNEDAQDGGSGSKWTISAFAQWMRERGHDFDGLWEKIGHMIVKSLIAAQPMLQYQYSCSTRADDDGLTCFELLGYDVLLDEDLRPWLLEVNHAPSLTTDTPLDLEIKSRLIREVLALAGLQPERIRAELEAKDRAKLARLYTGHAPSSTAAAVSHAGTAPSAAPSGQGGAAGSGPCSPGKAAAMGAAAAVTVVQVHADGIGAAASDAPPAAAEARPASPDPAVPAAGGGCSLLGPAAEPERGTLEWEVAQRAYEDAHLGQFDRIMPPDDPQLAALYERLLAGSLQSFYKRTMQGRNQQKLLQIKERRQQEEAEAAARQEALQRRAEGLRAWMAGVCQKHREERQLKAAAAAAEAAAAAAAAAAAGDAVAADVGPAAQLDVLEWLAPDRDAAGADTWGGSHSVHDPPAALTAREAAAVLQRHFAAARAALPSSHGAQPASGSPQQQQKGGKQGGGPAWGSRGTGSSSGGGWQGKGAGQCQGPFLSVSGLSVAQAGQQACDDSSLHRRSTAGSAGASLPRRPLSAGSQCSSRAAQQVTLEEVIEQRLGLGTPAGAGSRPGSASPASGAEPTAALGPPRPGSAALAAWAAAVNRQQGQAGEQHQQRQQQEAQPWQQQAWDACGRPQAGSSFNAAGSSSSKFLERVAAFTQQQQQQGVEAELASLRLQSSSSGSSADFGGAGLLAGGASSCSGSDADLTAAASSADGSVLAAGAGRAPRVATPALAGSGPPQLDSGCYIPPTLLSALHTVRMSPRLLSGLRSHGSSLDGSAAAQGWNDSRQQQGRSPWRGGGAAGRGSQTGATGSKPAGGGSSSRSSLSGKGSRGGSLGGLDLPWMSAGLEQGGSGAQPPAVAAGGAAASQAPPKLRPPAAGSPAHHGLASPSKLAARLPQQQSPALSRSGSKGQAHSASPSSRGSLSGALAGGRPAASGGSGGSAGHYRAAIEQQAVQSVAQLIDQMIHSTPRGCEL